jgi:hypothetical protein
VESAPPEIHRRDRCEADHAPGAHVEGRDRGWVHEPEVSLWGRERGRTRPVQQHSAPRQLQLIERREVSSRRAVAA